MNFIAIIIIAIILIYTLSYAKYNLTVHNWLGATGILILAATAFFLSVYVLFFMHP